jgi:hypothetical protein
VILGVCGDVPVPALRYRTESAFGVVIAGTIDLLGVPGLSAAKEARSDREVAWARREGV